MAKNRFHTQYKVSNKRVPSVTTIINNLGWNKNALIAWASRIAAEGTDPEKVKNEAANIGTLTHKLVEDHILGVKTNTFLSSASDIERAMVGYGAFLEWEKVYKPEYISTEIKLVSDEYMYGGTVDTIVKMNGQIGILDLKTSKGVYKEYILQLAAYRNLYIETTGPVEFCSILKLDKVSGGFEYHLIDNDRLDLAFEAFLACRKLHDLKRRV